jgi:bacillolysin
MAICEGLSDIWGAILEYNIDPSKVHWRIGEEIMNNGKACLRDIQYPKASYAHRPMADCYGSSTYNSGDYEVKSGVLSHWFYLLSEGGSGTNDLSNDYTVHGIGIDCATEIIFEAQIDHFTGVNVFWEARNTIIDAAEELTGEGSLEVMQAKNAWYAVGLLSQPPTQIQISGPDIVCASNSTFTLSNLPPGVSVNWNVYPPNLVTPYSGTGSSAIFQASCYPIGNCNLYFTISSACGSTQVSKFLIAGGPDYYDVELDILYSSGQPAPKQAVFLLCPNTTYHIYLMNNSSCSTSNYSWTIPGAWTKYYQYNNMISINTNSQPSGQIMVDATTCCANCGSLRILIDYMGEYWDCGGGYYMASPNPADSYIDIDINEEKIITEGLSLGNEHVLTMVDKMGMVKYKAEIREFPYRINTSNLPNGLYIINLINKNRKFSIRVMIEH